MKNETLEKLKNWASNNNWRSAHPLDEERFWLFVIEAYKNEDALISEDDFFQILKKFYPDEEILTDYYIKYENGIDLLTTYSRSS